MVRRLSYAVKNTENPYPIPLLQVSKTAHAAEVDDWIQ